MIELKGTQTDCKIFTDYVEQGTLDQVQTFLGNEVFNNCKVRFMPDLHQGMGAVIGTTTTFTDKIIPNVIGADISCGVATKRIKLTKELDLKALETFIRKDIPTGFNMYDKIVTTNTSLINKVKKVCVELGIDNTRALNSVGTMGGNNHFLELGKDELGRYWLTVHSGSRNFGAKIAQYHQQVAEDKARSKIAPNNIKEQILEIKANNKGKAIEEAIKELKANQVIYQKTDLEYIEGADKDKYIEHTLVAHEYAIESREIMLNTIITYLEAEVEESIESIHNYIDFDYGIIRKGAISAQKDELLVVPWNMRDGLIIGKGKGNEDWNCSFAHGAGRHMSRKKAKKEFNINEYKESMKGIYTACVSENTIDESPMAYKSPAEVEKYLEESVEILHRVKPVYNFKDLNERKRK